MSQNRDRGYTSFLSASRGGGEDTPWEIRKLITGAAGQDPAGGENLLKWHLILHLAEDLVSDRDEMEALIERVKLERSPLEEALGGEAPVHGLFEDLPGPGTDPLVDEQHMGLVFEAWDGLFSALAPARALMITTRPGVMEYAQGLAGDDPPGKDGPEGLYSARLSLPDTAGLDPAGLPDQQGLQRPCSVMCGLGEGDLPSGEEIERIEQEFMASLPASAAEKRVAVLIRRFPPTGGSGTSDPLSGRTLILVSPEPVTG
jgi:hypothetical protein